MRQGYHDADNSFTNPASLRTSLEPIRLPAYCTMTDRSGSPTSLPYRARDAEELYELVDEPHHKEPRVARHLRAGDQHAPEQDQHDRVERVADVSQSESRMVRTCKEQGRREHAKKIVRCTSNWKETERKTENQVERLVKKRYRECRLKEEDVLDRTKWKNDICNRSGDSR